jgi:hypothetical protein
MEYLRLVMFNFETTRRWHDDLRRYLESHPEELGSLLAQLIQFQLLLNESRGDIRPQFDGLTEHEMGIISIRQPLTTLPQLLFLAWIYPDYANKLATLIKIGQEVDRNADLEYSKKWVNAHLN